MDIPTGLIEDGKIMDKEKLAEIIKTAIKKAGPKKISTNKVICSLPESKIFLRKISIPRMKEDEIEEAIKWEIEASIPLSVDQVYFDWQLVSEVHGKQNILTVAISREIVDEIIEVLEICKLDVFGLEVESVATVRSLVPNDAPVSNVSLVVDLGAKKTSFIIAEGNIPYFTSSIPFSSEGITDAISKALGISIEEAEKQKINYGIGYSQENLPILNSIKPYLENLSTEIERSIDFYQDIDKDMSEVKKIILCGGGSNLKGLTLYLAKRLKQEVVLGDPWINLDFGNNLPMISKENSSQFSTAVGLAMERKNLWK
jgi:type IV pilus assembly protein PilM